jgi:hypothetical protein
MAFSPIEFDGLQLNSIRKGKKSTFPPSSFTKVRFPSLNTKTRLNTSLIYQHGVLFLLSGFAGSLGDVATWAHKVQRGRECTAATATRPRCPLLCHRMKPCHTARNSVTTACPRCPLLHHEGVLPCPAGHRRSSPSCKLPCQCSAPPRDLRLHLHLARRRFAAVSLDDAPSHGRAGAAPAICGFFAMLQRASCHQEDDG